MNDPTFLSSKIKMPSPRRNYLSRTTLFEKLDAVTERKLTIVKGMAGSGKTTLLTSFIKERAAIPFYWLTVDRSMDDALIFWRYFTEAVGIKAEPIDRYFALLSTISSQSMESVLALLISQMEQMDSFAIVLDDFHALCNEELVRTLEYLIKNSPPHVHFVLCGREEPPLYVSDLAVSGELLIVGESELLFSADESLLFLHNTLGLRESVDRLRAISGKAEGWAAGLQLMAIAAEGSAAMTKIDKLGKYAVEYLQKEILGALAPDIQAFMIKTSMLSSFNAKSCDRIFCRADSETILAQMLEKNLFLTDAGDEHQSFRYHSMFGDFLRLRFQSLDEGEQKEFHAAAARYYASMGEYEECVRHLIDARSYGEALKQIKENLDDFRILPHLTQIPLEHLRGDRDLVIQLLFYYYYKNSDRLKELFDAFQVEMQSDPYWRVLKISKAILVDFDFQVDLFTTDEIDSLGFSDATKAIMCVKTAAFLYMQYDLLGALKVLEKATALQKSLNNPFIRISVLSIMSSVKEELGELDECERLYATIFDMMNAHNLTDSLSFNFHIGLTGIYLKQGRLDQAEASMRLAEQMKGKTNLWADAGYLYNLMELRLLGGIQQEAYDCVRHLVQIDFYQDMIYASSLMKYLFYMGKMTPEEADRYEEAYAACEERFLRIEDRLSHARILHYRGQSGKALEITDDLLETVRKHKIHVKLIEVLLFKYAVLSDQPDTASKGKLDVLREAVFYASRKGIVSSFMMEGETLVKPLLELSVQRRGDLSEKEEQFIRNLTGRKTEDESAGILSEREKEVLMQLATGASNKEIGEKLFISLATVKTHIINIYSKLQVSSRVEAVEKARSLNLMSWDRSH